jgi:agmatinase
MELYDIETGSEPYRKGIHLSQPITENSSPEAMVDVVYQEVKDYLLRSKTVTLFGGEHSISIGSIRAHNEFFNDLSVLQIDAHADLRKSYEGSSCNHACAVYEASQTTNLVQVGIRSMDVSEVGINDQGNIFFAHEMAEDDYWMDKAIDALGDEVYITFDLDALDPSIMPSTGTPEPGGLLWYETLEFLKRVFDERRVVGFDIVELCPNAHERSSDFLAAKLYYKMLSYLFAEDQELDPDLESMELDNDHKAKHNRYSEEDDY